MKSKMLQPFKEAPPPERESCRACKTFAPECLVPDGDAALPMCWLCAHAATEHGCNVHTAATNQCECIPQDIYPHRTFAPAAPKEPEPNLRELERERLLFGSAEALRAWAREAHKQMSVSQHAAVKRRLN